MKYHEGIKKSQHEIIGYAGISEPSILEDDYNNVNVAMLNNIFHTNYEQIGMIAQSAFLPSTVFVDENRKFENQYEFQLDRNGMESDKTSSKSSVKSKKILQKNNNEKKSRKNYPPGVVKYLKNWLAQHVIIYLKLLV
jgi:hypothetical protein